MSLAIKSVGAGQVNLSYAETGSGQNPIVFVHGIPTDYRIWSSQLESFSKDFRAISYSRRHAFPNKNDLNVLESTVRNNSEDLINLMQELKLQQVHLVGHSYGGFISLYTAWKHPDLFRSLVLVEPAVPSMLVKNEKNPLQVLAFLLRNPSAAMSARRLQRGELKLSLKAYEAGDYNGAVKHFVDGIKEKAGAFEQMPQTIQNLMLDNGKTVGELETTFPVFTSSDARKISLQTLLVKGELSPKWLRAIVDNLRKSMPNSSAVEISGSGHLPHIENPSEFNARIQEFLKKSNSSSVPGR
jgi:non-heme chloroperoxidase